MANPVESQYLSFVLRLHDAIERIVSGLPSLSTDRFLWPITSLQEVAQTYSGEVSSPRDPLPEAYH